MTRFRNYKKSARSYTGKYRSAAKEFTREGRLIGAVVGSIAIVYIAWYALNYYSLTGWYAYVPGLIGLLLGGVLVIHKNEKTTFIGVVICAACAVLIAFQYGLVAV